MPGPRVTGSCVDQARAGTLGIPVKSVQTAVWSIATGLAFLALWLRASVIGLPVGGALGLFDGRAVVLVPLAARVTAEVIERELLTDLATCGKHDAQANGTQDRQLPDRTSIGTAPTRLLCLTSTSVRSRPSTSSKRGNICPTASECPAPSRSGGC